MTWLRRALICVPLLGSAPSCASNAERRAPGPQRVKLAAGLAARVGSDDIALVTVTTIAQTQRVSLAVAREHAISDAQFAAGARLAFEGGSTLHVLERAAYARALLQGLQREATARGPATDAEVSELTALRWQEFDRPETVRTTHAVAMVEKPEQDGAARALALRILEAVRSTTDPAQFIGLAQAVPHDGLQVRAERLPPVTRDGRLYFPDGAPPNGASQRLDAAFSAGAFVLAAGKISDPVKSVFGYHIILCEARLPELRVPLEQRRRLLADEVAKGRAERSKHELLDRLMRSTPVSVARPAEDLTARVRVAE
jgi:hypothetical protein